MVRFLEKNSRKNGKEREDSHFERRTRLLDRLRSDWGRRHNFERQDLRLSLAFWRQDEKPSGSSFFGNSRGGPRRNKRGPRFFSYFEKVTPAASISATIRKSSFSEIPSFNASLFFRKVLGDELFAPIFDAHFATSIPLLSSSSFVAFE